MPRSNTVFEVAKLANVSIATVSRALNNPSTVREELRNRVLDAARELGYASNPAAKALRERRSKIIAIVVPTLDDEAFSRMVNGLQAMLHSQGYVAFVQVAGFDNAKIFDIVKPLFDRGAEALAIVGRIYDRKLLAFLEERRLPSVCLYSRLDDDRTPSIGIDNTKAVGKLIDLLLSQGHEHIAMIAGTTKGNDRQQTRIAAFKERMRALGHAGPVVYEVERRYTLDDGAATIKEVYEQNPEVTAVICSSHIIALGVMAECRKLGIDIPKRLSVTGFDDFSFAALLDPPLTALSVPTDEIGRLAADALIGMLDHGRPIVSLELDPALVVRGSTAMRGDKQSERSGSGAGASRSS